MNTFRNSPFEGELDVVATLAGRAIEASVSELRHQDELTIALRSMIKNGVDIDNLSAASGLTIPEIRRRIERELNVASEVDEIAGLR